MFDTGFRIGDYQDLAKRLACEIEDTHDEDAAADMVERRDGTLGPVFFPADRVPARGEVIKHGSGIEFEMLHFDPRLHARDLPALMSGK